MKGTWRAAVGLTAALALSGCGAAYYGTALAILQSQKDRKTTDVSFPDGVPTSVQLPAFATLRLSATPAEKTIGGTLVNDLELLGVDLPLGYGESLSNRDAGTTLVDSDRLVIRINGDTSRELVFTPADAATDGAGVAASIQAKVRLLTPSAGVPVEAYSLFSATFDPATRCYRFRSGAPGAASEVRFQTTPRVGGGDAALSTASEQTAARLGLGEPNRGIERSGAQALSFVVLNRGTDVIPEGTPVSFYLSRDKVLDTASDVLFDRIPLSSPVQVGEARRYYRTNDNGPPSTILRPELPPGRYWVLLFLESAGEQITDNNLLASRLPIEVYDPVDDPATSASETAAPLDFVLSRTTSPIAVVTSANLVSQVGIQNVGAPVATAETLNVDVLLSADQVLDEPAQFADPSGALAGIVVNPTSPLRPITVRFEAGGSGGVSTTVAADTVLVNYDASATVQQALTAINASAGGLVVGRLDGNGAPATDTLQSLLSASLRTEALAKDSLLATQAVTFAVADRPLTTQSFAITAPIPPSNFVSTVLPLRLFPLYRLRPALTVSPPENAKNNVRRAANFLRVYDRNLATLDPTTGAILPTVNGDDFARLEAVTQRPVNTGTIRQGQQRVFSFEIPDTGLALNESQLLVIVDTTNFDAHLDLLSSTGTLLANNDDSALGSSPLVYTALQGLGSGSNLVFYLVVSTALFDESDLGGGGEQFNITISVNPREPGDPGPVGVVNAENVVDRTNRRFSGAEPLLENDVLIPFGLGSAKGEVVFVLPQRARVLFRTSPVFSVGVDTVITAFVPSRVPAPVQQQAVLGPSFQRVVYRPSGGSTENAHVLERGVYTVAFESQSKQPDTKPLRLEVDTEFIPED